ncbi:PREDICTED: zinc finger protein 598-like [Thamnophis sirtalis]|uniref:Zinc finger protein 598-like n=1 Tax=Thamnophis sirtalis TaxID=35019 RepID=A0A6I9YFJ6_9SAUR|nr:PREDICTED: zinc finger protein 598-like [Thamnophis sirtalis]
MMISLGNINSLSEVPSGASLCRKLFGAWTFCVPYLFLLLSPQVVFGKKLPAFSTIILSQLQHEKKYDIYFTDGKIYALYRKLLQHECPLCTDSRAFPTIVDLEQHMRKQHELFCGKLCGKHLKIFTYERKWYSRKDLARHRIHGDPDDTSHRGHPLCKFCDERYLDNDELLKHLRRDHYFCHFCDSDGAQEYYRSVTPADP